MSEFPPSEAENCATDGKAAEEAPSESTVTFGSRGIRAGFIIMLPVALGVAGYGIAFGILANQAGLSTAEVAIMSATVVAGASQIVAVELWANPVPVVAILFTTFALNLRYSLMGAALHPWFQHLTARQAYGSLFFMADENWALTLRDLKAGHGRGAFLLGSGFAVWSAWVLSSVVGTLVSDSITDPTAYGIDFVLAVIFVALAVELWDGTTSVIPWTVALGTALIADQFLPGQWYILLGGFAAFVVEVIRYD